MILRQKLWILLLLNPLIAAALLPPSSPTTDLAARHGSHEHEDHDMADMAQDTLVAHNESQQSVAQGPTHSHGAPKEHFDPASLPPDPLSYFVHDVTTPDGHGGLMGAHIFLMLISWLGFLPMSLFLRAAKHPLYHFAQLGFVATLALGLLVARIYKAATPDLYPNNKHSPIGWLAVALAMALFAIDTLTIVRGLRVWFANGAQFSKLGSVLIYDAASTLSSQTAYEMVGSPTPDGVEDDEDEVNLQSTPQEDSEAQRRRGHRAELSGSYISHPFSPTSENSSRDSNDTLHENERQVRWTSSPYSTSLERPKLKRRPFIAPLQLAEESRLQTTLKYSHVFLLRTLLVLGYACFILGIVEYSGKCRATYINGCLAHLIKGSIFLAWGLLSFGRYLGAWSELGWAWNRKPESNTWRQHTPSAEFVECFLIFFYGATNTFMERFGANEGDPFSIHEIQHISIAICFFGLGALGLMLESKSLRRFLADGIRASQLDSTGSSSRIPDPPSYSTSFNPIPAIVAAVTGLAMSAHHQEYVFAQRVHQLWGYQLVLFGVLRISTYAFLWLRPPASVLPSRPPTEALAAFFCACGGVIFMLSTEQVVFAAMANGLDDVMTINNLALAGVGTLFAWQAVLMAIKGWAASRMSQQRFRNP